MDQIGLFSQSHGTCNCDRCGATCTVAVNRNEASQPFKLSLEPKGLCAECVMTQFLCNAYPVNMIVDEGGLEQLLDPAFADAFLSVWPANRCDLNPKEVNWQKVIDNWDLPITILNGPTNPYIFGESEDSKLGPRKPGTTITRPSKRVRVGKTFRQGQRVQ